MHATSRDLSRAFRSLDRRLAGRRYAALGTRGRAMLALLGMNAAAFAYWQAHGPLAGLVRAHGARAGTLAILGALAALALAGGALTAWRRAALAARPPGPEWLALPVPPGHVVAHLRTEARWAGAIACAPALGVLLACAGRLPAGAIALLAAAFTLAWIGATQAGAAIAWRARLAPDAASRPLPAATRALVTAARSGRTRALAPPRWRREPAWRALARLDALVSWRGAAPRARLAWVALGLLAGFAAWLAPAPPLTRRALAFAGFLPACAMLGAWAIVRTCAEAEVALRPLPLALRDAWRARAGAMAVIVCGSALLHALLAAGFGPAARAGLFVVWVVPGFVTALLGLHYALTLGRRATLAEGLYVAWLTVALVASLMIPLLGWGVLLAGVVHSSLRLSRWWRPEPEEA
jgi:hypothetical protein